MIREKLADIKVDDYTSPSPISVSVETNLSQIHKLMKDEGVRHIPVFQGDDLVGIISDRDMKIAIHIGDGTTLSAADIMTREPYSVSAETPLEEVAFEMSQRKIGSAIVTDDEGRVTGIFTSTDALNALIEVIRGDWK